MRNCWLSVVLLWTAISGGSAQVASPDADQRARIAVDSTASIRADPLVAECARRVGGSYGGARGSADTVGNAVAMLRVEDAFSGLIACRLALLRFPAEPTVIVYNVITSYQVSVMELGADAPEPEAARVELMMASAQDALRRGPVSVVNATALFFLGQAHEFGVGVERDPDRAAFWYGQSPDRVSRQRFEGLVQRDESLRRHRR